MSRHCYHCKHVEFYFDSGYSEYTPGDDIVLSCARSHFDHYSLHSHEGLEKIYNEMKRAETCKDFKDRRGNR